MRQISHSLYQEDLAMAIPYIQKLREKKKEVSVLVVGATGLVGSFLVDAMLYYNVYVEDCITVYAMGRDRTRLEQRFKSWKSKRLMYLEHDIQKSLDDTWNWDYIFHLASNADPGTYALYPVETITTNILGSVNVIEYVKKHKETKVLFTSTMEVYGESEQDELMEADYGRIDYNLVRAGYPESKRVSELLYRSAVKQYGIHCVIARLGYIYGSTMTDTDNKVVAEFIRCAVTGKKIVLKSTGLQRRTYCYVADAINGLLLLMTKGENAEAYNIADKKSQVTIRELAEIIAENYNLPLEIMQEYPTDQCSVHHTVLDTKKIEKLGWRAYIGLQEGIRRTVLEYNCES